MADQSLDREMAGTSKGGKASYKSNKGSKSKQPSKAELKDLERRQKALERQIAKAALQQTPIEPQSHRSDPSVSRQPQCHTMPPLLQAWSPEGVGESSTFPASLDSGDQIAITNPFDCHVPPAADAALSGSSASVNPPGIPASPVRPPLDPFKDLPKSIQEYSH